MSQPCRRCWVHTVVILGLIAPSVATGGDATDMVRRATGRMTPARPFDEVWVVDRALPRRYEILTRLAAAGGFRPVVLAGGEGEGTRASELNHLLEMVPPGTSYWVGDGPVPVDLGVDRLLRSWDFPAAAADRAVTVYCPDRALEPLAALLAMRLGADLTTTVPAAATTHVIQVGGAPLAAPQAIPAELDHIAGADAVRERVNDLADRAAVMVYRRGSLLPEHVLYAFQRQVLLLAVEPPPYHSHDAASEIAATLATRDQIHAGLVRLGFGAGVWPEALIIAADWEQIPYRFARSPTPPCAGCDNGVFEHSADVEYANLDHDPWGEPEVAVGRLVSYEPDLLALQTVVGVWRDHGAFPAAARAVYLDLLAADWREQVVERWRDAVPQRDWLRFGPGDPSEDFRLDQVEFFSFADDADLVLVRAHGGPNSLSTLRHLQLDARTIGASRTGAMPAFWIVEACATGRYLDPAGRHGTATREGNNLLSAIQSRLALGALLAVEVVGQASGSIWWPTVVAERGLSVGELVRRATAAAIATYRGDDGGAQLPAGDFPGPASAATNLVNGRTAMYWIGDPLTVLD